jgi:hypothetical protein
MEDIKIIDETGQPRSDEDLQEAINVCREIAVKHTLTLPILTLHILDIISLLEELQVMRRLLAEAKKKRLENQDGL